MNHMLSHWPASNWAQCIIHVVLLAPLVLFFSYRLQWLRQCQEHQRYRDGLRTLDLQLHQAGASLQNHSSVTTLMDLDGCCPPSFLATIVRLMNGSAACHCSAGQCQPGNDDEDREFASQGNESVLPSEQEQNSQIAVLTEQEPLSTDTGEVDSSSDPTHVHDTGASNQKETPEGFQEVHFNDNNPEKEDVAQDLRQQHTTQDLPTHAPFLDTSDVGSVHSEPVEALAEDTRDTSTIFAESHNEDELNAKKPNTDTEMPPSNLEIDTDDGPRFLETIEGTEKERSETTIMPGPTFEALELQRKTAAGDQIKEQDSDIRLPLRTFATEDTGNVPDAHEIIEGVKEERPEAKGLPERSVKALESQSFKATVDEASMNDTSNEPKTTRQIPQKYRSGSASSSSSQHLVRKCSKCGTVVDDYTKHSEPCRKCDNCGQYSSDLPEHMKRCQKCNDCGEISLDLRKHKKACRRKCNKCGDYAVFPKHTNTCQKWLLTCESCHQGISRDIYGEHRHKCKQDRANRVCRNCQEMVPNIAKHLKSCPKTLRRLCNHCQAEVPKAAWGDHIRKECPVPKEQRKPVPMRKKE